MGVDFSSADALVAEHGLDGAEVGSALQKSRCERMAQRVGRDGLRDAGGGGSALDHDEYHRSGEMGTATVEKNIVFLTSFDVHVATGVKPIAQLFDGAGRNGHQPLLPTLADNPQELFVKI